MQISRYRSKAYNKKKMYTHTRARARAFPALENEFEVTITRKKCHLLIIVQFYYFNAIKLVCTIDFRLSFFTIG